MLTFLRKSGRGTPIKNDGRVASKSVSVERVRNAEISPSIACRTSNGSGRGCVRTSGFGVGERLTNPSKGGYLSAKNLSASRVLARLLLWLEKEWLLLARARGISPFGKSGYPVAPSDDRYQLCQSRTHRCSLASELRAVDKLDN
ncbi:hypothetical protein KR51_00018890 [Rubidibacter lacunae KORDI 51-2]|uniref:Uncharacterized protein n=1 Tax=Rubidibacter lacunae KORDI 51-2 TaxID=582515 RepID=U5DAC7_9CHRO|nr:hypothetical protein KR51_00018890 [Rubidibacter lacunae KORDI 51-2]